MKLLIPLAVVGVVAAGFGLYTLKATAPTPTENIVQVTPTPTAVVTPIQTKESLDAILLSADAAASAEQAAAATAETTATDQTLSAEEQALKSLNTSASTYAN